MDRTAIERLRIVRRQRIAKMQVRDERRQRGEEEDSAVMDREAVIREATTRDPKHSSTPAPAKAAVAILSARPSWQMVIIVAIVAAVAVAGGWKTAIDVVVGWFKP